MVLVLPFKEINCKQEGIDSALKQKKNNIILPYYLSILKLMNSKDLLRAKKSDSMSHI